VEFFQYNFGEAGTFRQGDYWIIPGQEEPRTEFLGHIIILNLPEFIREADQYFLYDVVFNKARQLGGLIGFAHFFYSKSCCNARLGHIIEFADGLVDFVELLENDNVMDLDLYYEVLNMGLRPSLTAGSDFPWGHHLGDQRMYVYVDTNNPITTQAWFDGIQSGKTFVTQGPLLEFKVNGKDIGSFVHVQANDEISIESRAFGHPDVAPPLSLALIVFGDSVAGINSNDPAQEELILNHRLVVDKSQWIAIRAQDHKGAMAHSAPIYVIVDQKPTVDLDKIDNLKQTRLERIDSARGVMDNHIPSDLRDAFIERLDRAQTFIQDLPDNLSPVGINAEIPLNEDLKITVDPQKTDLLIDLPNENDIFDVYIYSINGKIMSRYREFSGSQLRINTEKIKRGVYLLKVTGQKEYFHTIIIK
jgi:hypothetical protein